MKLDVGMLTHDLKTIPDYARKVEALGFAPTERCPPASPPCATIASTPAAAASRASCTVAIIATTFTPRA